MSASPATDKECPLCSFGFPRELLQPVERSNGRRIFRTVPLCPLCSVQLYLASAGIIPPDPSLLRGKQARLLWDMAKLHLQNQGKTPVILLLPDAATANRLLDDYTE